MKSHTQKKEPTKPRLANTIKKSQLNELIKPKELQTPINSNQTNKHKTKEQQDKVITEILAEVSEGVNISIACKDKGISFKTFYNWISKDKNHLEDYNTSRKMQVQKWINDYFLRITDDSNDVYNGKRDNVQVQRDRLIGDTLKWYASKILPNEYGDKIEIEHTGKQSNTINQINIQVNKYEDEPQQISIKKSTALYGKPQEIENFAPYGKPQKIENFAPNGEEKGPKSTTTHTKSKNNLKALEAEIIEEIGEVGIGRLNLSKTDRIGKSGVEDNLDILDINGIE